MRKSRSAFLAISIGVVVLTSLVGATSAPAYKIVNEWHWPSNPAKGTLLYCFQNGTSDIAGNGEREAVRKAMNTWEAAAPRITFSEISYCPAATIKIKWNISFLDPAPGRYDIVLNSAGFVHAATPNDGDIIFDESETWTLNERSDTAPQPLDLQTVALHALGHSLGLGDTEWDIPSIVMYPVYWGSHRFLQEDDINGVLAMYTNIT